MVVGEVLVVEIESTRLERDLDNRTSRTTERFFAALEQEATLSIYQTNPTAEIPPKVIHIGPANTTVYRNGSSTFLAIQTGNVTLGYDPPQDESVPEPDITQGERFAVTFGYDVEEPTRGPEIEFQQTAAELYGIFDPVAPELINRSVAVRIEPERNVSVNITLENATTISHETGPVTWSGYQGVALDFRGVEPGTNYTLDLIHDGDVVDSRAGTVREPEATIRNHSIDRAAAGSYNAGRLNVTASLSHGGHVLVEDESGQLVGSTRVPPEIETRTSIPLIPRQESVAGFEPDELHLRAVRETPPGETPYGGPDATMTIDVTGYDWGWETTTTGTPTATDTATSTRSPTPTTTAPTGTDTTTDGDSDTGTTNTTVPGLGFGAAIGSIAAAALLLARRRSRR